MEVQVRAVKEYQAAAVGEILPQLEILVEVTAVQD
jgi:hypothetical protein